MTEYKYFRVVLPNTVDTAAAGEGFIDDKDSEEFSTLPSTRANSILKEQANMRWEEILKALKETGAVDVQSIAVTTANRNDANVAPTQIDFTVKYGVGHIVHMYDLVTDPTGKTIYGPASLAIAAQPGYTYTTATEAAVIERAIATALSQATTTADTADEREIFDPTLSAAGSVAFPNQFTKITLTQFGTGGTQALRMASIEAVGGFTVTQLAV